MKIGIIGLGKMGEAIALGLQESLGKSVKIQATTRSEKNAKEISKRLSIACHTDNRKLVEESQVILMATKPQQLKGVLEDVRFSQTSGSKLLISVCASLTTDQLLSWAGGKTAVIRAMPNTPCLIKKGMTVLVRGEHASDKDLEVAEKIFGALGKTAVIDESLMDGATGLSGCGPAYAYLIIEALSEAGVKVGLPRKVATQLAAQTLLGASEMVLERGIHPAALKDEVTTPGGCTVDGLMALEEGKLRVTLIKAVLAAAHRSKNL